MKKIKKRYFPCPVCKGRGDLNDGEYDDFGSDDVGPLMMQVSPDSPCFYCDAKGMIEIDGAIQKRNKAFKLGMEYLNKHHEEDKTYSYEDIVKFGEKVLIT